MFFNTANETGTALQECKSQAETQEDKILSIFKRFPERLLSPEEVYVHLPRRTPLTSVRRALTCLTSKGLLTKTDTFKRGSYGKQTHTWRLNSIQVEYDESGQSYF